MVGQACTECGRRPKVWLNKELNMRSVFCEPCMTRHQLRWWYPNLRTSQQMRDDD